MHIICLRRYYERSKCSPLICTVLDDLKQNSIDANRIWLSAGRPRSGPVFNPIKNAKYSYRLATEDAVNSCENKYECTIACCRKILIGLG